MALIGLGLAGCATVRPGAPDLARRAPGLPSPYIDCRGPRTTAPTVVLEAGAFGTSADWNRVLRDIARSGRVCAYDRLGLGASPDRRDTPTPEHIAADLAALLDRLGETRPIVLVGHSNGAFYAETFATLYPDRVAGVAYVDGVGTDDLDNPVVVSELQTEESRARFAAIGGRMGLARLVVGPMIDAIGLRGRAAAHKWEALTSPRHLAAARDEVLEILPGLRRIKDRGGPSRAIPTAVIVASQSPGDPVDEAWREAQIAPARRACQGWALDAVGASHVSPLGRDRSYVLAAVRWLETPGLKAAPTCDPPKYRS